MFSTIFNKILRMNAIRFLIFSPSKCVCLYIYIAIVCGKIIISLYYNCNYLNVTKDCRGVSFQSERDNFIGKI